MRTLLLATLFALLAGCTTPPTVDWAARVGNFTHDQAVLELGPPVKSTALDDGSRMAEWLVQRGRRNATYFSLPDGRVIRTEGVRDPDQVLRLTFGSDGKLKEWKRIWR